MNPQIDNWFRKALMVLLNNGSYHCEPCMIDGVEYLVIVDQQVMYIRRSSLRKCPLHDQPPGEKHEIQDR